MAHNIPEEKVVEAVVGSGAIMSVIAKRLQVAWHTAERHVDKWPSAKQAWTNEQNTNLDMAESQVLMSMKAGSESMVKWYLSKKGKERGYADSIEVSGVGGEPVRLNLSNLSDLELEALAKVYEEAEPKKTGTSPASES